MKLVDHVCRYITEGLSFPEIITEHLVPKGFRFVHANGHVVIGKTLNTATRPPRDILRDIAIWEERSGL